MPVVDPREPPPVMMPKTRLRIDAGTTREAVACVIADAVHANAIPNGEPATEQKAQHSPGLRPAQGVLSHKAPRRRAELADSRTARPARR